MRLQVVLMAGFFCLTSQVASEPNQTATTSDKSGPQAKQTLIGCVDEQDGEYILLDDSMLKIASLQSAGSDNEIFAKYLGRRVQVSGNKSTGKKKGTFKVASIENAVGTCGQAQ